MDYPTRPRAIMNRQPLSDATHRVSNSPAPAYTKMNTRGKESPHWNQMHPAMAYQPENHPATLVEPVHTNQAPVVVQVAGNNINKEGVDRVSQFSNVSSNASSIRARKTHIGPWQLGKTLGKGSSARVRAARHHITRQFAAVKIVAKSTAHLTQAGSLAKLDKIDSRQPPNQDGVRRMPLAIEREVAILKLIEHPNIVKLYDIWENRAEIYLVLEYVEKGDLFEFINWQGRLREEEALYYFRQMMSAIQYCHSLNICHRDLKPENILLTSEGQVKIADFGMAALHQSPSHHLRTACGSPHYAAPELLKQRMYKGEMADIWSMGVILFAMLAGRLPFDEPDMHNMLLKAKRGDYTMPPFLSPEAKDFLHRTLQVEPRHRISMAQMWRHPLVTRYDYLDDLNANGGQPPDIRRDTKLAPLVESDIDPQILRQLRSVWHTFSEKELKMKLLNNKPNDEKLFYRLLFDYRETQMENFNQHVVHSRSDFHHLRPPNLGKRMSTCQFTQSGRNGHTRSVSRFTVISNVAESESGTAQSYDPYNASRVLQPCDTQASHARIVVHRNDVDPDIQTDPGVVSHSFRSYRSLGGESLQQRRKKKKASQRLASGPAAVAAAGTGTAVKITAESPMGSTSSLKSGRTGNLRVRTSSRHKRGVDFSSVRRRPNNDTQRNLLRNRKPTPGIVLRGDSTSRARDNTFPASPGKKRHSRGATAAAKTAAVISNPRGDSMIWNDELKLLGSTIAEHCDEAFRSSLLTQDATQEPSGCRESSPLSFSLEGSTLNQFPKVPATAEGSARPGSRPWDSRPLPPIPADANKTPEPKKTILNPFSRASAKSRRGVYVQDHDYYGNAEIDEAFAVVPDRRTVSAPVHSQHGEGDMKQLPPIDESRFDNRMRGDPSQGARTVSAPANAKLQSPAPLLPSPQDNKGVEYLSKVENTIRVVESPSNAQALAQAQIRTYAAVPAPRPLNLRKKPSQDAPDSFVADGRCSRMDTRGQLGQDERPYQHSNNSRYGTALRNGEGYGYPQGGVTKKKPSLWFKRSSRESTKSGNTNQDGTQSTVATAVMGPTKKRSFNFSFWKSGKNEPKMSLAGPSYNDTSTLDHSGLHSKVRLAPVLSLSAWDNHHDVGDTISATPNHQNRDAKNSLANSDGGGRKIEVHQNWLARLFRVKPATRYLCLTVPRRRARQEVAHLLREWRKYGIKDVEVDRSRDLVFARLDAKNYLNIREVAFAAEIMTVIEHGKRNPLSIVRFTQERGAASSFYKVVDTIKTVLDGRGRLVADKRKSKMMIKTLNSSETPEK